MDSPLRDMWRKIKHWFWWHFKATEQEKHRWDIATLGIGFTKNGKRINPKKLFVEDRNWENDWIEKLMPDGYWHRINKKTGEYYKLTK